MPSPFPGMDPYLEGYLWPDVHNGLAFLIKEQLAPRLMDAYTVVTDTYMLTDTSPGEDIGIMYPDVELLRKNTVEEPAPKPLNAEKIPLTPATLSVPRILPVENRIPVIEIRERSGNQLITAIEILSPVNKRKPGLASFQRKRVNLQKAGVHFLEIDLLRRGKRTFRHPNIPAAHYLMALFRSGSGKVDIWAIDIKDPLPVLPVPLRNPDPDTYIDLGLAFRTLYERSYYQKSIDYLQDPPPPAFSDEDRAWMRDLLAAQPG